MHRRPGLRIRLAASFKGPPRNMAAVGPDGVSGRRFGGRGFRGGTGFKADTAAIMAGPGYLCGPIGRAGALWAGPAVVREIPLARWKSGARYQAKRVVTSVAGALLEPAPKSDVTSNVSVPPENSDDVV
jgi:hypothetical protein